MEPYQELEVRFAQWMGYDPGQTVACASGTAALHLAMETLQLPAGSRCVVPNYTMIACPRACTLAGLVPVFVDCQENDLLLDTHLVEAACAVGPGQPPIRAVLAVHIYGRQVDVWELHDIARRYNLEVVEDLAEAHGLRPHPKSWAATWSFYKNKTIHGEEGGIVCFREPSAATLARQLRSLGFTEAHDYTHVPRGHNYRLSNAHATLILESLGRVYINQFHRYRIAGWYNEACPLMWRQPKRDVVWVYDARIPDLTYPQQDAIVRALNQEGIAARHGFKPMTSQVEYFEAGWEASQGGVASREVIYLPVQPGVTLREDCYRSFEVIQEVLGRLA